VKCFHMNYSIRHLSAFSSPQTDPRKEETEAKGKLCFTYVTDEGSVDERRDGVGGEREGGGQSDAENVQPNRIQCKPAQRPAPLVPFPVLGLPRRSCFLLNHGLLPATSTGPTAAAALCEAGAKGGAAEP